MTPAPLRGRGGFGAGPRKLLGTLSRGPLKVIQGHTTAALGYSCCLYNWVPFESGFRAPFKGCGADTMQVWSGSL